MSNTHGKSIFDYRFTVISVLLSLQIVLNTWDIMVERDISMDNVCSSLMLRALCKGGCLDEVNHNRYLYLFVHGNVPHCVYACFWLSTGEA